MNQPLDDIFQQEKPISIEALEQQRLQVIFEWITSFSVLLWAIALIQYFKTDWVIVIKSVLLIGLIIVAMSTILSLIIASFKSSIFNHYNRFNYLWLLLMSVFNSFSMLISFLFIV